MQEDGLENDRGGVHRGPDQEWKGALMIYIGILSSYPGGWRCRMANREDGEDRRCTGEEGATPVEAIKAATVEWREFLDQFTADGRPWPKPLTLREAAVYAGFDDPNEILVLIPIRQPEESEIWDFMA
jgi:hypothetical protein